jgi:hypothetical protein
VDRTDDRRVHRVRYPKTTQTPGHAGGVGRRKEGRRKQAFAPYASLGGDSAWGRSDEALLRGGAWPAPLGGCARQPDRWAAGPSGERTLPHPSVEEFLLKAGRHPRRSRATRPGWRSTPHQPRSRPGPRLRSIKWRPRCSSKAGPARARPGGAAQPAPRVDGASKPLALGVR